jgi:hypothetical protein
MLRRLGCGFERGRLVLLGPGLRGDVLDLPVGQVREAGEHVAEVGVGIDPPAAAAFDDRIEDGSALAGLGLADEEPILFADGRGADGVFVSATQSAYI